MGFIWMLGVFLFFVATYLRYLAIYDYLLQDKKYLRIFLLTTKPLNRAEAVVLSGQMWAYIWIILGFLLYKFITLPQGWTKDLVEFVAAFAPGFIATAYLRWVLIPRIPK